MKLGPFEQLTFRFRVKDENLQGSQKFKTVSNSFRSIDDSGQRGLS